jgi:hypothetical protein
MTLTTYARIAGYAFLVYIAAAITAMVLFTRATSGEGVAAQLATIAQQATDLRLAVLLSLLGNFCALVLAVTLYALTRKQDADVALLALTCRVAEGIVGMDTSRTLGLLWLATAGDATALDTGAASALGAYFLKMEGSFNASATFFAVGSTLFSWLLLRGRLIPAALAWLGVLSSLVAAVCHPLQLVGLMGGPLTSLIWLPVLLFEVVLTLWLIIKGVALPTTREMTPAGRYPQTL